MIEVVFHPEQLMLQINKSDIMYRVQILFERGTNTMKRFSFATVAVIIMMFVLAVGTSWAYESQKTKGGLTIELSASSYPLVMGDNDLKVKVTDEAGKALTDARVKVRFYMPPMAGMAPMSTKSVAELKGKSYRFKGDVAMQGTWKAEVRVQRKGKKTVTVTFNLDAR
jgi:hypothetical protein